MTECQHGCSRDFLVRDLVDYKLAAEDALRDLAKMCVALRTAPGPFIRPPSLLAEEANFDLAFRLALVDDRKFELMRSVKSMLAEANAA